MIFVNITHIKSDAPKVAHMDLQRSPSTNNKLCLKPELVSSPATHKEGPIRLSCERIFMFVI
jgi:hypothetical protein